MHLLRLVIKSDDAETMTTEGEEQTKSIQFRVEVLDFGG